MLKKIKKKYYIYVCDWCGFEFNRDPPRTVGDKFRTSDHVTCPVCQNKIKNA